jgi:hypothetical protein
MENELFKQEIIQRTIQVCNKCAKQNVKEIVLKPYHGEYLPIEVQLDWSLYAGMVLCPECTESFKKWINE